MSGSTTPRRSSLAQLDVSGMMMNGGGGGGGGIGSGRTTPLSSLSVSNSRRTSLAALSMTASQQQQLQRAERHRQRELLREERQRQREERYRARNSKQPKWQSMFQARDERLARVHRVNDLLSAVRDLKLVYFKDYGEQEIQRLQLEREAEMNGQVLSETSSVISTFSAFNNADPSSLFDFQDASNKALSGLTSSSRSGSRKASPRTAPQQNGGGFLNAPPPSSGASAVSPISPDDVIRNHPALLLFPPQISASATAEQQQLPALSPPLSPTSPSLR